MPPSRALLEKKALPVWGRKGTDDPCQVCRLGPVDPSDVCAKVAWAHRPPVADRWQLQYTRDVGRVNRLDGLMPDRRRIRSPRAPWRPKGLRYVRAHGGQPQMYTDRHRLVSTGSPGLHNLCLVCVNLWQPDRLAVIGRREPGPQARRRYRADAHSAAEGTPARPRASRTAFSTARSTAWAARASRAG